MVRTYFPFVVVLMLAVLGGSALALVSKVPAGAQTEITETRTVALDAGWNLAGWTGPDTPLADAIAGIVDATEAAATFDAVPQTFETWNASGPDFLNTLDTIFQGQAVWVLVTASINWVQPVVADPGALALRSGFNLVTWAGATGLAVPEAFAALGADLDAAFAFNKPTETFASFGPNRPTFLNDLAPLSYGEGIWVSMDGPADWTQPPASPPAQITSADGSATLDIPRGALPADLSPNDLSVTAIEPTANLTVEGGTPFASFRLEPSGTTFAEPVILRLTEAVPVGEALFAALIADDGTVTSLDDIFLTTDLDTGLSTLNVAVPHFSLTEVWSAPAITIELSPFAEPNVGDMFSVTATVTLASFTVTTVILSNPPADKPDLSDRWENNERSLGPWTLWGFFNTGTNISPLIVNQPEPAAPASGGAGAPAMKFTQTFTCLQPGFFIMSYAATGNFDVESRLIRSRESRILSDETRNRTKSVPSTKRVESNCRSPKQITNLTAEGSRISVPDPRGPMYPASTAFQAIFTGTIVGSDGKPVAGATVTATVTRPNGTTASATATSDADGGITFSATSASPGTFTIVIDSITCPDGGEVAAGDTISVTVE